MGAAAVLVVRSSSCSDCLAYSVPDPQLHYGPSVPNAIGLVGLRDTEPADLAVHIGPSLGAVLQVEVVSVLRTIAVGRMAVDTVPDTVRYFASL